MWQAPSSSVDNTQLGDNDSLFGHQLGGGKSTDKSAHQLASGDNSNPSNPITPIRVLRPVVHHTPKYADMNGVGATDRNNKANAAPKIKPRPVKGSGSSKSKAKKLEKSPPVPKAPKATKQPIDSRSKEKRKFEPPQPPANSESKSKAKTKFDGAKAPLPSKGLAPAKSKKNRRPAILDSSESSSSDSDSSAVDSGSESDSNSDSSSDSESESNSDSDVSGTDTDVFRDPSSAESSSSSEVEEESNGEEAPKTKGTAKTVAQSAPIESKPPAQGLGGRPSAARKAELESGIEKLCQLLTKVVKSSGFRPDRVIDAFLERNGRGMNPWNTYQQYLQVPAHRKEEIQRLPEDERVQIKEGDIIPTQLVGRMYELFKEETQAKGFDLLATFRESLDLDDSNVTFRVRDDGFHNWCGRIQKIMKEGSDNWSFDSVFLACGRVVNQDQSLCELFYGGMGADFFSKHFDAPESVIQGHFRTHVYSAASKSSSTAIGKKFMEGPNLGYSQPPKSDEGSSDQDDETKDPSAQQDEKLRNTLNTLLEPLKLSKGQRWKGLPNALASKKHTLVNWPYGIGFPYETAKKKGIAGLLSEARKAWFAAIEDTKAPMKLVPWPRGGTEKDTPVIVLRPESPNALPIYLFKDMTTWLGGIDGVQVNRTADNQWVPLSQKSGASTPPKEKGSTLDDDIDNLDCNSPTPHFPKPPLDDAPAAHQDRGMKGEKGGANIKDDKSLNATGERDEDGDASWTKEKKKEKGGDKDDDRDLVARKAKVDRNGEGDRNASKTKDKKKEKDGDVSSKTKDKKKDEDGDASRTKDKKKEQGGDKADDGSLVEKKVKRDRDMDGNDDDTGRPTKKVKKVLDGDEQTKKKDKKTRTSGDKTKTRRKNNKSKYKSKEMVVESEDELNVDSGSNGVFNQGGQSNTDIAQGLNPLIPPDLQLPIEESNPSQQDRRTVQGGVLNQYGYQYAVPSHRFGGEGGEGPRDSRRNLGSGYPESHSRSGHLAPLDAQYSHSRQYSADRLSQPPFPHPLSTQFASSLPGSRQVSQEYRNSRQVSPAIGPNFNTGSHSSNGDNMALAPSAYDDSSWSSLPSMSPNPSLDMRSPRWNNLQALPDNLINPSQLHAPLLPLKCLA